MINKVKSQFKSVLSNRYFVAMMILALAVMPSFAQSDTIAIDTGIFISEINTWLALAISIVAIGVGIAGAFALAKMVGKMIVDSFNGRI